jgi:cleavage stimulation factor subunit 3
LYDLFKQLKSREAKDLAQVDESAALDAKISAITGDEDEETDADKAVREVEKKRKQDAVKETYKAEETDIKRAISFTWIALMQAMRRIQGKGVVKGPIGGMRQIFADARQRGKILSEVYVETALLEHHVYKDPAGTKIFERGAKLFPEDAPFILEYLKHLLSIGDITNARVAFETSVNRLTAKPDLVAKAKILYSFLHKYESRYGDLANIHKLEKRMEELWPEDPKPQNFADRFRSESFDPTSHHLIVSPASQMRNRDPNVIQSIEVAQDDQNIPQYMQMPTQNPSPRPQYLLPTTTNSPKRPFPFPLEEIDDPNRPRKVLRGQSPLKGAAGRRLEQQQRLQQTQGGQQWQPNAAPFVIPRDITFLISIIPRAEHYSATRFNPEAMIGLLAGTYIPNYDGMSSPN